jgi:hydroxymethylbilane synthase
MLPQVGQGALAVECRADDDRTIELLGRLQDPSVRSAVDAERAFLACLGGGCDLPVGAYATETAGTISIEGMLASLDGHIVLRDRITGPVDQASSLGKTLAGRLLEESGGVVLADEFSEGAGQPAAPPPAAQQPRA